MAGQRVTDLTALAEQTGSGDLFNLVDVNDTTGSAQGTSKSIDSKFVIQTDKFSLSNAEVIALDTSPKTLIGALSGYMPTIYNVTVLCTHAAPDESTNKALLFGFDSTVDTDYWGKADRIMSGETTDCSFIIQGQGAPRTPVKNTSIINTAFICWADSTGFAGGWSCDIYVTYAYTKVL
jgi:hypothetical protein|tara:strand:+ start:367 stop:903 length:537 start_codon:yes stop_codon:yes gene_type:complete